MLPPQIVPGQVYEGISLPAMSQATSKIIAANSSYELFYSVLTIDTFEVNSTSIGNSLIVQ